MNKLQLARKEDKNLDNILHRFEKENPNKQLILLFKAGSHFFDLNGPNSDTDYRGIYIDDIQDSYESNRDKIYLLDYKTKEVERSKNSKDDCDVTLFSLSSFIKLLKKADFNSMEILYTPEDKILFKTPLFDELVRNRNRYIVNDTSAFIGFIRREAKRFGVNIYNYDIQMRFLNFLRQFDRKDRMFEHWDEIKVYSSNNNNEIKFLNSVIDDKKSSKNINSIVVASRMHISTATVGYVIDAIEKICETYGHRSKDMATGEENYKGLYHAMRLIYEANDIFDYGEFKLPFSEERHRTLWNIKNNNVDKDWLFSTIDDEIEKIRIRDMNSVSNRKEVEHILDKLESTLKGRMTLQKVLKNGQNR